MIFRPELAVKVIKGEKTATRRRLSDKPRSPWWKEGSTYTVGQVFLVQPGRGIPHVAEAKITRVAVEPLSALLPADARREGFPTRDAFVDAWRAINGSWDPDERVHVVEFELVGPPCFGCEGTGRLEGTCPACFGTGIEPSIDALMLVRSR